MMTPTGHRLTAPLVLLLLVPLSSAGEPCFRPGSPSYRSLMRSLVIDISEWAKEVSPGFLVLPQNGQELFTVDGEPGGAVDTGYLGAIDGTGREDLFFGYQRDDLATPERETERMRAFLDIGETHGVEALVTDYCRTLWKIDSSYSWNRAAGYVSFAADSRGLDTLPSYPGGPEVDGEGESYDLSDVRSFLYLIDPGLFADRQSFVATLASTDYDLLIIDLFWNDEQLTPTDLNALTLKPGGGSRLVLAYLSIGEAEDYRYYWQEVWSSSPPAWLEIENPEWEGNYLVEYWDPGWRSIIYGGEDSYLSRIIHTGFHGVYLDRVDSFETWQSRS